jgi:hypothetical protein
MRISPRCNIEFARCSKLFHPATGNTLEKIEKCGKWATIFPVADLSCGDAPFFV